MTAGSVPDALAITKILPAERICHVKLYPREFLCPRTFEDSLQMRIENLRWHTVWHTEKCRRALEPGYAVDTLRILLADRSVLLDGILG